MLTISTSNVIPAVRITADQLPKLIKSLQAGTVAEFLIYRDTNVNYVGLDHLDVSSPIEAALISKDTYDALLAGATATVPSESLIRQSDDFVAMNILEILDILQGKQQAGYNAQVAAVGTKFTRDSFIGTVPSGAPYVLDVGAIADAPVVAVDSASVVVPVASVDGSLVYFGSGSASVEVTISFGDLIYTVYEIHQTMGTATDPVAYLLNNDHYEALLALQP